MWCFPVLTKIDCSDDPYDVTAVTRAILARVHHLQGNEADPSKPVVVLMGEVHDQPSHRLLMQGFLAAAKADGLDPSFHMEHEHRLLSRIARIDAGVELKGWQAEALTTAERDGKILLQATMAYRPLSYNPVIGHNLMAFCLENAVPVAFTDAAKSGKARDTEKALDQSDRETAQQIAAFYSERFNRAASASSDAPLSVEGPDGIAIRNRMMVDLSGRHLDLSRSNLLVHHCGREHLLGDTRSGFDYADSLAARFAAQGYRVVTVFPDSSDAFERVPKEALCEERTDIVLVEGLSTRSYPVTHGTEQDELLQFCKNSGGLIDVYETDPEPKRALRGGVRMALERLVKSLPKPKTP